MAQLKNVSIVLKPKVNADFERILPNLATWLLKRKKTVSFIVKEKERILKIFNGDVKNLNFIAENDIHTSSDLIITMGGDGTFFYIATNTN